MLWTSKDTAGNVTVKTWPRKQPEEKKICILMLWMLDVCSKMLFSFLNTVVSNKKCWRFKYWVTLPSSSHAAQPELLRFSFLPEAIHWRSFYLSHTLKLTEPKYPQWTWSCNFVFILVHCHHYYFFGVLSYPATRREKPLPGNNYTQFEGNLIKYK